jgi:hypothetical protein
MNTDSASPSPAGGRLLSVDFWRGYALLTIFINHIPGNFFVRFTHRNFGFSDATEVFVMLAGVAAAFAYLPYFRRGKAVATSFRIVQRAFHLYMAHIVLIVFCGAIIAYAVTTTGDNRFLEAVHLDVLINDTIPGLIGLASLSFQPAYLDILPLYVVLMLMTPAILLVASRSMALALTLSVLLYVAAQVLALNFSTYPAAGTWFLNPLCWQLLFTIGIALGAMIAGPGPFRSSPVLLALSAGYLAISGVWIVSGFFPLWDLSPLPRFVWEFDKSNLHLPRLLHVLALTYVLVHLPVERWLQTGRALRPVAVLGRHSLAVFALGTVLAVSGQLVRAVHGGGFGLDVALIGSGIALLFACAGVLEWNRVGQAGRRGGVGAAQAR